MSDRGVARDDKAAALPRTQPWAALALVAFGLNWLWEMLQGPLYESMRHLSIGRGVWLCTLASVGDVVLTLIAFATVAALAGSRTWLVRHQQALLTTGYVALGVIATAALEVLNVQYWARWSYATSMPRVFGIGVMPLAQWAILPVVTLWIVRRYLHRTAAPFTRHDAPPSHTFGDSK
jgi:hypothetical protein